MLFQNNEKVVLVVARKKISAQSTVIRGTDETDGPTPGPQSHSGVKVGTPYTVKSSKKSLSSPKSLNFPKRQNFASESKFPVSVINT